MMPQAEGMCRLALDSLFTLGALVRSSYTMEALADEDAYQRKLDFRSLRRNVATGHAQFSADELRALEGAEAEISANPGKHLSVFCTAVRAGLDGLYGSAYRSLSKPAHSALRDVERGFALDEHDVPTTIQWGPDPRGLDFVLFGAITCLRSACIFAAEGLGIELGSDFIDFERRYQDLERTKPPALPARAEG